MFLVGHTSLLRTSTDECSEIRECLSTSELLDVSLQLKQALEPLTRLQMSSFCDCAYNSVTYLSYACQKSQFYYCYDYYLSTATITRWLSGRASDLRSKSRGFEAQPRRC